MKNTKSIGFFKRLKTAIFGLENYIEFTAENFRKSLGFMIKMILILSLVLVVSNVMYIYTRYQGLTNYIDSIVPNFTYENNELIIDENLQNVKIKSYAYPDKFIELIDKGIIRNKLKIKASINNAKIFKEIQKEYGSFYKYLRTFTNDKIVYEIGKTTSKLSDEISKDLQKRGMKFVGSTIIYSYLQAIGVINSHEKNCFLYKSHRKNLQ